MCPLTPGASLALIAYSATTIVTLVMFLMRYPRFWIGLIVMAGLMLFSLLESFVWMIVCSSDYIRDYLCALRKRDAEEIEITKKEFKDEVVGTLPIPFIMALMVAVFGLIAIPVLISQWISDLLSEIHKKFFKQKCNS